MLKERFKKIFIILLILLGITFIFYFVFRQVPRESNDSSGNIILIGIDGASWKVMRPLINEGRLPNIAKLVERGTWGVLLSEQPMYSPALWTSIATGKKREKHGILNMVVKKANIYNLSCPTSIDRRAKAFWNILTDYGRTIGIINWWITYPAEQVNGYVVSDYFLLLRRYLRDSSVKSSVNFDSMDLVYPKGILKIVQKYQKIKTPPKEFLYSSYNQLSIKELISFIHQAKNEEIDPIELKKKVLISRIRHFSADDVRVFLTGEYLLKHLSTDLFAIYLQGLDTIQHSFWEFYEPNAPNCKFNPSKEEIKMFGQLIPKYYEWYDHLIGQLLKEIKKENTTVIIISDHGFSAFNEPFPYLFNLNFLFEKLGWLKFENEEICWSKSFVYYPLTVRSIFKPICINLQAREPNGIVKVEEYEEWREKVKEKLLSLEAQNGKDIFEEIKITEDPKENNIDLKVKTNPLLSFEDRLLINGESIPLKKFLLPFPWSGEHHPEGIIIMSGKHIKRGKEIKGATIFDVTPTILALLGVPIGKDMDGRVLSDAIEEDFLLKKPVIYIDSHDDDLKQRRRLPIDPHFDTEMIEKLRSIGYLH